MTKNMTRRAYRRAVVKHYGILAALTLAIALLFAHSLFYALDSGLDKYDQQQGATK